MNTHHETVTPWIRSLLLQLTMAEPVKIMLGTFIWVIELNKYYFDLKVLLT